MKKCLIALIVMTFVTPVFAHEDRPPLVAEAHARVAEFLQLTPGQIEDWDALIATHREEEGPAREAIRQLEAELRDLMDTDEPDPVGVGEIVIEIAGLRAEIDEIHRVYLEGFATLLDDEQSGRLGFIRRAERAQPLIPAFRVFELIPRH